MPSTWLRTTVARSDARPSVGPQGGGHFDMWTHFGGRTLFPLAVAPGAGDPVSLTGPQVNFLRALCRAVSRVDPEMHGAWRFWLEASLGPLGEVSHE